MIVFQSKYAEKSIRKIAEYISEEGYPETAISYILRLKKFISFLKVFPEKFALCKQPQFVNRNFQCAIFENTYIIVYKIKTEGLFIYNVIHGARLK